MENESNRLSITQILVTSAFTGALLGIPKFCFTGFFYWIGVTKWYGLLDSGSVAFKEVYFPMDFPHLAFAAFVYIAFGGILAIVLGFILTLTGKRYRILKGAYFGFFIWIVFRNFFTSITLNGGLPPQDVITAVITYIIHMAWGAITACTIARSIPFKDDIYIKTED